MPKGAKSALGTIYYMKRPEPEPEPEPEPPTLSPLLNMMCTGYIMLLFKGGDPRDLANWRPVTKVPRALSIMESVLKLRLFPLMGLITAPDQISAAPGRDMMHAIVPVLDAIDFAASPNSPAIETLEALHMILLDAVKAFDRSDRGLLIRLLAVYCGLQLPCRDDPLVDTLETQRQVCAVDFLRWIQIVAKARATH